MILQKNEENTLPEVIFEEIKRTLSIKGKSISLAVVEHFDPFFPYFKKEIDRDEDLKIIIDLEYFNTKASRILLDIFKIAKKVEKNGRELSIDWYYEEDDDDMLEAGEDYSDIIKVPFNFIEKSE